jgi:hypothetical protein
MEDVARTVLVLAVVWSAGLLGCGGDAGIYVTAGAISENGFVRDEDEIRALEGREVMVWGFVDDGNLYGDDGAKEILGDWWCGAEPRSQTWRFNLKANPDDETGHSFPVHVPNDQGRDDILRAFVADARAGLPTRVFLTGRISTFPAPTNTGSLTGLYMELDSSRDISIERPDHG